MVLVSEVEITGLKSFPKPVGLHIHPSFIITFSGCPCLACIDKMLLYVPATTTLRAITAQQAIGVDRGRPTTPSILEAEPVRSSLMKSERIRAARVGHEMMHRMLHGMAHADVRVCFLSMREKPIPEEGSHVWLAFVYDEPPVVPRAHRNLPGRRRLPGRCAPPVGSLACTWALRLGISRLLI